MCTIYYIHHLDFHASFLIVHIHFFSPNFLLGYKALYCFSSVTNSSIFVHSIKYLHILKENGTRSLFFVQVFFVSIFSLHFPYFRPFLSPPPEKLISIWLFKKIYVLKIRKVNLFCFFLSILIFLCSIKIKMFIALCCLQPN